MFLLIPLILSSGLLSVLIVMILASLYGVALIVLALMIRSVRQETSRDGLRRFLYWLAIDHMLSAATALSCAMLIATNPSMRKLVPLLQDASDLDNTPVIMMATLLAFFMVLWILVGLLLMLIAPDLDARISIQRQLRWHPWTTTMIWVGLLLSFSTLGILLIVSSPLLWHLMHVSKMGRQSTLIWTLAIAIRQNLPLGPEVLVASEGLWGRQRLRLLLLSENLDAGSSLATSLERQPGLVPRSAVMQIRMGEETGLLATAVEHCALEYARKHERESDLLNVQQAFMLLLIPLLLIPNILGFLCYYIVPKFKKIFEDFGMELPALTLSVVNALEPSSGVFFLMFLCSIGLIVLIVVLTLRDWERGLPLVDWLIPRVNGPPILRGLALVVREQRSLTAGVQGLMWSHPRVTVRTQLSRLYQSLQHGGDLANSLAAEHLIRRSDIPLLRAAERVQNLPWSLEQLAANTEAKFWYRLRCLLEIGYPVAVVGVGLIVFLVVAGFFMPLVKMLDELSHTVK